MNEKSQSAFKIEIDQDFVDIVEKDRSQARESKKSFSILSTGEHARLMRKVLRKALEDAGAVFKNTRGGWYAKGTKEECLTIALLRRQGKPWSEISKAVDMPPSRAKSIYMQYLEAETEKKP